MFATGHPSWGTFGAAAAAALTARVLHRISIRAFAQLVDQGLTMHNTHRTHFQTHQPHRRSTEVAIALTMAIGRGPAARLAADLAGIRSGERVVDIGCGPGTALREASRRGATGIGVDPSRDMRRLGRVLTRGRTRQRVTYIEGVAEAIPCDDSSADVAWALSSAHHWTNQAEALSEVHRILKPGGRLLVLERVELPGARTRHHAVSSTWVDAFVSAAIDAGFASATSNVHGTGRERRVVISGTRA
jgi:SAM-dependent methyltransferase